MIQFRVAWLGDDQGQTGEPRPSASPAPVQPSAPKGGMRFHPSVTLSILKFLAFEQTLKNSLTTLPMGGAKGGSGL